MAADQPVVEETRTKLVAMIHEVFNADGLCRGFQLQVLPDQPVVAASLAEPVAPVHDADHGRVAANLVQELLEKSPLEVFGLDHHGQFSNFATGSRIQSTHKFILTPVKCT